MSRTGGVRSIRARPMDFAVDLPYYVVLFVVLGGGRGPDTPWLRALPYVVLGLAVLTRWWWGCLRIAPSGLEDRRYLPARSVRWSDVTEAPRVVTRLVTRVEVTTGDGRLRLSTPAAIGPFGRPRVDHVRDLVEAAWREARVQDDEGRPTVR